MLRASTYPDRFWRKLVLSIGFVSVAGAVILAHQNPAAGYEVSLYTMTPMWVWVGLLAAFSISLGIAFSSDRDQSVRSIALSLGGLAAITFVGLPIIRGYHFYGQHDSLTHLGWTRAIVDGTILPFDLAYPGIHTSAVFISSIIDVSVPHSLLLVVLLLATLSFVFIPLSVNNITSSRSPVVIATFGAFMLLPITTISTHMHAHPTTQAIFYSTLFVYLLTKFVYIGRRVGTFSTVGLALAITSTAAVLFHPQLAAHLLVVALGICFVQFIGRRWHVFDAVATHRSLYGQTLFLAAVFVLWTANFGFYLNTIEHVIRSMIEFITGAGQAGESIAGQGVSLSEIGVGMGEILLKLFGPHLFFALFAGGLVLATFTPGIETQHDRSTIAYFTAGLAGLGLLFGIYFFASGGMYFRVFGLIMVFIVIIGTLAVSSVYSTVSKRISPGASRPVFAVGLSLLLVVSLLAVFPSPYIYQASPHVSDKQAHGYETMFETRDEEVEIAGLRGVPNRFDDAVHGNPERMKAHETVPESAFEQPLTTYYSSDRYLVLTSGDYDREQLAYRGLRYTEDDFDSVGTQPGVDLVQSNGEFDLYYVTADNSSVDE